MTDRASAAHLVLGAELGRYRFAGEAVGGSIQKAVLWVIWACEGRPVSLAAMEARAGCAQAACFRAVQALLIQGLISEVDGGGCRSKAYRLNLEALRRIQTTTPLFAVSGTGPRRERPVFAGQVLPVPGRSFGADR